MLFLAVTAESALSPLAPATAVMTHGHRVTAVLASILVLVLIVAVRTFVVIFLWHRIL